MNKLLFPLALCSATLMLPAHAAPLDAFLSANQNSTPGDVQIEAAYDLVNSTVDFLKIRDNDASFTGTNVGDYHGAHVRAGVAITPKLWVDGALWQRRIDYRTDLATINTWQLAGQYKLLEGAGYLPSVAVRLGTWGNYADELKKSSPTTVRGVTLNSVNVAKPQDVQYQLDVIGTSKIFDNTELSVFAGGGASEVSLDSVTGTTRLNGCNYNVVFGPTNVVGMCSTNTDSFSIPNSLYGIDINNEAQYNATFLSGGLMLKWQKQDWQVRGGYQYQSFNRNQIDSTITSRGGVAYQSNHILLGDVMYRLFSNTAIFVRGQYMTNQFTGEIPLAYNTLTASRFNKRYGILSAGLVVAF
ncbi:MAG: hypothetical protein Q7T78_00530 [Rhodoferax sp.]|nr:hypothetical protein [Rhodoferax sp.]